MEATSKCAFEENSQDTRIDTVPLDTFTEAEETKRHVLVLVINHTRHNHDRQTTAGLTQKGSIIIVVLILNTISCVVSNIIIAVVAVESASTVTTDAHFGTMTSSATCHDRPHCGPQLGTAR